MDLDTTIKLVALGYTGNYYDMKRITAWFKKNYGVWYKKVLTYRGDLIVHVYWKKGEIIMRLQSYTPSSFSSVQFQVYMIKLMLKLFITKDEVIYGPDRKFLYSSEEWT